MAGWIEPPPPAPRRLGCVGKGCLILSGFILFLFIAGAVGIYLGFKHHSALAHGIYWAEHAHLLAQEPSPVPQFETSEESIQVTLRKWNDFENAVRDRQSAHVELTADDLNNFIAHNQHLRGKAFVSLEENRLRVQMSLPLAEYVGRKGYYLNGDAIIQSDGPRPLDQAPLKSVTINDQALPADLLDWRFRSRPLRTYLDGHGQDRGKTSFEIRAGKLILDHP